MAPFSERPDSVKPGSRLGPFDGQVLDADTQQPLPDAVVSCSWGFDRGVGTAAPDRSRTYSTRTDVDGRYRIPALRSFAQGLSARLARLSFVIYKKEYVAYRQDFVFPQKRPRHDFAQRSNLVKLSRWSPELSRVRHLLFLGGGPELEAASSWEALAAAAELDRGGPAPIAETGVGLAAAPPPPGGARAPPPPSTTVRHTLPLSRSPRKAQLRLLPRSAAGVTSHVSSKSATKKSAGVPTSRRGAEMPSTRHGAVDMASMRRASETFPVTTRPV
jgi:hypothetical protein